MPRKRTANKRRLDAVSGADAWAHVFKHGCAMFDDFTHETGVETDFDGHVPQEAAEAAWRAYGGAFLALYGREPGFWAISNFGEPTHAR